jgi:cytidylate kinase
MLGFRYLDREILSQAAKSLGLEECELEPRQERLSTLWERALSAFAYAPTDLSYVPPSLKTVSDHEVFTCQAEALQNFASQHDCVIMGRAAHHILASHAPLLRIALHAPTAFRVARMRQYANARSEEEAIDMLERYDHERARFLKHVTGAEWNCFEHYDICMDTSVLTVPETARALADIARMRFHLQDSTV